MMELSSHVESFGVPERNLGGRCFASRRPVSLITAVFHFEILF
jgi:hypothetical protein